jgi:signal transduction histidine kinase
MTLSIRQKLLLLTISILSLSVALFAFLSIMLVNAQGEKEISDYRHNEMQSVEKSLEDYVAMAYAAIETRYNKIGEKTYQEQRYGRHLRTVTDIATAILQRRGQQVKDHQLTTAEAQRLAIKEIENLRFDNGSGYVWINDNMLPFPRMIMHPTVPSLNGTILNDEKFNCALDKHQNLFQAAVEVSQQSGGGFVNYTWPKPTPEGLKPDVPKLSYVTLFEQWGWVVGSGVYIDEVRSDVIKDIILEVNALRYDSTNGYFWINDLQLPYPTMVTHPKMPQLNGKVLNDTSFNCTLGTNQNFFQAIAETLQTHDSGFIQYRWKNDRTGKIEPKLSYFKKIAGLNWAIATGVYISHIEHVISEKEQEINHKINRTIRIILLISLFLVVAGASASYYFSKTLVSAINKVKDALESLASGKIISVINNTRKDELGQMTISLNSLVKGISTYNTFANEISNGNLEAQFEQLSDEDSLGNSLELMRSRLQRNSKTEKERAWHNEGMASLLDVVRKNGDHLDDLCVKFISNLCKYVNANQGTIYLVQNDKGSEQMLERKATFAYDKRKFETNSIAVGDGLLGQAFLEKELLYLTDLPKKYIRITSGLGDASPTSVVIIPLVTDDKDVNGVIELAFFRKLEEFEITFLRKIAENIAGTISNVKRNQETKQLLLDTQKMTEQLRSQEEELRQNSEELMATQETLLRQLKEVSAQKDSL